MLLFVKNFVMLRHGIEKNISWLLLFTFEFNNSYAMYIVPMNTTEQQLN